MKGMGFEVFGVLLAAGIQGVMLIFYNSPSTCVNPTNLTNITNNSTNDSNNTPSSNLGEGYLLSAGFTSFIYIVCCLATFFGTTEMKDVITDKNQDFLRSIKKVFKHKSYITLLVTFLLSSLAIQV